MVDSDNQKAKELKLEKVFNNIPIFDELMIGYFRSCVYNYIINNKEYFNHLT